MNCKSWCKSLLAAAALLLAAAPALAFDRADIDAAVAGRLDAAVADLQAWSRT